MTSFARMKTNTIRQKYRGMHKKDLYRGYWVFEDALVVYTMILNDIWYDIFEGSDGALDIAFKRWKWSNTSSTKNKSNSEKETPQTKPPSRQKSKPKWPNGTTTPTSWWASQIQSSAEAKIAAANYANGWCADVAAAKICVSRGKYGWTEEPNPIIQFLMQSITRSTTC